MIDLSPNIIYEDEHILAINKPAGLVVHSDGRTKEPSVSEWLVNKYPESKDVGEKTGYIERPGVVHRIDRETSGILLLARTSLGHKILKEQFKNREIEKIYHAFVYGNVRSDEGVINLAIGRNVKNFKQWAVGKAVRGEEREAVTYYKVLRRTEGGSVTFVEVRPRTGRTHQIRVHFKSLHHPVVMDALYASKQPQLLGFSRLALHAREITFRNVEGKLVHLEAPYPADFKQALGQLARDH